MNTQRCRYCNAMLDEYGWCLAHDVPGFRAGCPTVELSEGTEVKAVWIRPSAPGSVPTEFPLEDARLNRLVYVERSGHNLKVYLLNSRVNVEVGPAQKEEPK